MTDDRPTTPCELCGKPTPMLVTKRCDRCWELESRIEHDQKLAWKILKENTTVINYTKIAKKITAYVFDRISRPVPRPINCSRIRAILKAEVES